MRLRVMIKKQNEIKSTNVVNKAPGPQSQHLVLRERGSQSVSEDEKPVWEQEAVRRGFS